MTHLTYRNGVSIAEIIVYIPALLISCFLAFKHGIGRSAGWYFLIIFSLARIIGPAMQLATINNPTSIALYSGSAILNNIGLSPLMLASIGLLSRLLDNIHKTSSTILHTGMLKIIELVVVVGLILGIVGGVNASSSFQTTGRYIPGNLNKAGTALFIVAWVALAVCTILASFSIAHAEHGERRLFYAVAVAIPLLLIRLAYSIGSTFTHSTSFNLLLGNVTLFLCLALIEEFIIVVIFLGIGVTLKKVEKIQHAEAAQMYNEDGSLQTQQRFEEPRKENVALRIAKKTIVGRIVMSFVPEKDGKEQMEMNGQHP